jgi:hypothetical protein
MVEYIIFLIEEEALDLISRINTCMGYPSDGTITWQDGADLICEFDLETGEKQFMGYGVMIKDKIKQCLTEVELSEILVLPSNINTCEWVVSGSTN